MNTSSLNLSQKIQDIAEFNELYTPERIIRTHSSKIKLLRTCTEDDVKVLKKAAASAIAKQSVPVSTLLKSSSALKWSRLSLGCLSLDRCMGGGILTRGITEICGAAGVGKTQLLLQMSLTVQLPYEMGGFGKCVTYICTEDVFPSKRLFEMAKAFGERYPGQKINYMGNIYIEHVRDSDDLLACVIHRLKVLMDTVSVGLIVIDSVAGVFRTVDRSGYIKRAIDMRKMVNSLLHYVDQYNCAVICVNQVSTISNNDYKAPCLGFAWANLGRTRIRISKIPKEVKINTKLRTVRKFEIMYSPETPSETAEFIITDEGIVDVPQKYF